jgi:hypothetical protein
MKKLAAIALLILVSSYGAYAQDALQYTTMGSQQQGQQEPQQQESQPASQPAESEAPPPADAAQPGAIIDKMADAYYINCLRKTNPNISQQNLQGLCECTAKRMKTEMTPDQIKVMAQNDEAGRQELNHMLLDVYAPCMNYPVESMVEKQCLSDPKTENLPGGLDREKICYCMAERTGQWFTGHGRELMQAVIAKDPNVYDPVGPAMDDPSFKKASYANLMSCITGAGQ